MVSFALRPQQRAVNEEFLKPLVTAWLGKIALAIKFREPWADIAKQAMQFFCGSAGDFWDPKFQQKFLGNTKDAPRFRVALNKAFEVVALYGPVLYNRNPVRSVKPYDPLEFGPEVLGDPNDPNVQQYYQQLMQTQQSEHSRAKVRCDLVQKYLNYTPREQPVGGLKTAAEDAITEALVKGRGVLWPNYYSMPGSDRVLTGCFFDSVDNLLIDPDAHSLEDAKWVARRRVEPIWAVERKFNLKKDQLKGFASYESADAQANRATVEHGNYKRQKGETFDLITYYEIWSKGGVGTRLTGVAEGLGKTFDKYCGDFCYIAVAPNVPWPLNAPAQSFTTASPEDVQKKFKWPIEFWRDGRWPMACLDFYRHPNKPWPIALLAPAMGELTFLNFMIAHLTSRIWSSQRTFIGVAQSMLSKVEEQYNNGSDLAVFGIPDVVGRNIKDIVQFLEHPDVPKDAWAIFAAVMEMFDKRTGLTEIMYGLNVGGKVSRTATDVQAKTEKASIRPDYMAGKVEEFLTEVSAMEKLAAHRRVRGKDVSPLLGKVGAQLWDQLFTATDPEIVAREMLCTVEAGSVRKPNFARDMHNIQQIYGPMSQQFVAYAQISQNPEPLNELNRLFCQSLQKPSTGLQMGAWAPPPPPPGTPDPQQQEMQMKQQEAEMDMQIKQQEAQMKQQEAAQGMQVEQQKSMLSLLGQRTGVQADQTKHTQEIRQAEEEHDQDMEFNEETHQQDMRHEQMKATLQSRLARIQATAKIAQQSTAQRRPASKGSPA